jgi:glycerol-3-phosphate acyltransferase PlsY
MILTAIVAVVAAYLLGSIHFAWVITYMVKHQDIRKLGNRNPGAGNVTREVGIPAGFAVLALDAGKGLLVIFIARWLETPDFIVLVCAVAAVVGHMWSVYYKFHGGGGAATTVGVLFTMMPLEFSISFIIMAVVLALTRNFALAMAIGVIPLPFILWAFGADAGLIVFSTYLPLLLAFKNIKNWPEDFCRVTEKGWRATLIDRRLKIGKKDKAGQ